MAKKVKIIREFVDTKFKEIEPEDKETEEKQEESADDKFQDSGFSDFSSAADRAAPAMQFTNESQSVEPIEQTLEDVPSGNKNKEDKPQVYNMPEYGGVSYERIDREQREKNEKRDIEMNITPFTPRNESQDDMRKFNVDRWQGEMQHPEMRRAREEYEVDVPRAREEEGLPFEDRKKKRFSA